AERIDRHREHVAGGDDRIEDWSAVTTWDQILARYGWTTSGKTDQCGCEIWTRPGDWSSPKSATAHEPGCGLREVTGGVLHIWTDSPPAELSARKDWSKLQVVAAYDHAGDNRDAMTAVGILDEPAELPSMDRNRVSELLASSEEPDDDQEDEEESGPAADPDPVDALLAELIPASDLDKIPPPVPLVNGLLDRNSLARVIGKSGHGKSFFMIDIAGHVALGKSWHGRDCSQGDVVYMVAEGAAGIRKRVRAWEQHHGAELGTRVKFLPRPVQVKEREWLIWVAAMSKLKPALIVIDTQARVTAGSNENGPEDMGMLVHRAELLRQETGACVVLVHHKGHNGDHGRGHSSVIAAMDAEIEVTKEGRGKITVLSTKQKDQEDFEPIRLDMVKVGLGARGSAVLVAPGETANAGDPFAFEPTVDEQSTARDRLAKWIYAGFNGGVGGTKGEIKSYVMERDRSRRGKPMSRALFFEAWRDLEHDAVLIDMDKSRFILASAEVERLGLKSAS
ncbi:MAG TPA: AAA family ATPase, partial [Acidimicrobiales bacterium]|nr:AAA family ATPase [Acidimicrobiales bacterium]